MTARLQSLGDSFSCGEGVGVRVPLERTWAGLLAGAEGLEHRSLAAPGARVRDVLATQLPAARPAALSTLLVGLNDVARTGFDAGAVASGLQRVVHGLVACSDRVVVGRLQDPSRVLWMPPLLADRARRRVSVVNAAVDEVAVLPRVQVLDLGSLPGLRRSGAWAVDRVHPSPAGHAVIAAGAAGLLGRAPTVVPVPRGPGLLARAHWSARHGGPYLLGQLVGAVLP